MFQTLSVPLSNRQLNEVASTLDTHKHGVLDLRSITLIFSFRTSSLSELGTEIQF